MGNKPCTVYAIFSTMLYPQAGHFRITGGAVWWVSVMLFRHGSIYCLALICRWYCTSLNVLHSPLKYSTIHLWPTIKSNNAGLLSLKIEWRGKYRCSSESCFKVNNTIPSASWEHREWKIIQWATKTINMPIDWARTFPFSWPGKKIILCIVCM